MVDRNNQLLMPEALSTWSQKGQVRSQRRALVLERWHRGLNPPAIAEELDVSVAAVHYHLAAAGEDTSDRLRGKLDVPEMLALYAAGESMRRLSVKYDVGEDAIERRLSKAGVHIRRGAEAVPRGPQNVFYKDGRAEERDALRTDRHRYEVVQIAAICLGRPLAKGWVVHHQDENPTNNDPANLWLFPGGREHGRYHAQRRESLRQADGVDAILLVSRNGGLKLPAPPVPIVFERDTSPRDLYDTLALRLRPPAE